MEPDFQATTKALGRIVIDVPGMLKGIKDACHVRGQEMSQVILDVATRENVGVRAGRVEAIPERFAEAAAGQARYRDLTMFGWSRRNEAVRGTIEAVISGQIDRSCCCLSARSLPTTRPSL